MYALFVRSLVLLTLVSLMPSGYCAAPKRPSAVTYSLSGGRLGDNLIAFLHAAWISYTYDMPLLYQPFDYADQFAFHTMFERFDRNVKKQFASVVELGFNQFTGFSKEGSTLYIVPYFPESAGDFRRNEFYPDRKKNTQFFTVDWEDAQFRSWARELLKPVRALTLVHPPADCLSIALHVRKNSGGFDPDILHGLPVEKYDPKKLYVDRYYPLKMPPMSYYIQQLRTVLALYPEQRIYVYLFTDDPHPEAIVAECRQAITCERITWDYRRAGNSHTSNVVEDFFSMQQFDCLIRPDSNLSIIAGRLGDFECVVSPVIHHWHDTTLHIDKAAILMRTVARGNGE